MRRILQRLALCVFAAVAAASYAQAHKPILPAHEAQTLSVASDELCRYWYLITGKASNVPVRLRIDPAVSRSGNDAYTIVTENDTAVIAGSNARSVLYGVYDLLERRGGCGWFWDGDRIPKKKSINVSKLNVHDQYVNMH